MAFQGPDFAFPTSSTKKQPTATYVLASPPYKPVEFHPTAWKGHRTMEAMRHLTLVLSVIVLMGCGGKPDTPVFQVRGQVFYQGKPTEGALVIFHPIAATNAKDTSKPRGYVRKDGNFQLTTRSKDDGAPAGEYKVTILWRKKLDEDEDAGPNLLPREYGLPHRTPLRATVGDSPTKLEPFRIDSP